MKNFLSLIFVSSFIFSCNVRDESKTSIDSLRSQDSLAQTSVLMIDSVYDFGNINEGDIAEFSFRFKNTGKKPLIVSNTSASCGCTVPEKPEEPIMPGKEGFIKVKFNSSRREGEMHKQVTVVSNANPAFPKLILKGNVTPKEKSINSKLDNKMIRNTDDVNPKLILNKNIKLKQKLNTKE